MAFEKYNIYFVSEYNDSFAFEHLSIHLRSDKASSNKFHDLCGLLVLRKKDIEFPAYAMYYLGK